MSGLGRVAVDRTWGGGGGGRQVAARSLARRMCCAVLCCAARCCVVLPPPPSLAPAAPTLLGCLDLDLVARRQEALGEGGRPAPEGRGQNQGLGPGGTEKPCLFGTICVG